MVAASKDGVVKVWALDELDDLVSKSTLAGNCTNSSVNALCSLDNK